MVDGWVGSVICVEKSEWIFMMTHYEELSVIDYTFLVLYTLCYYICLIIPLNYEKNSFNPNTFIFR